jgi:predicted membrane-bound spermidine synthase
VKSMALLAIFFASGTSGLIYQVVWVRQFGHVFGNTVYSASMVVAIFLLGLGAGSYLLGAMADRRYQRSPDGLVRLYGVLELLIAGLGLLVSLVLPHLGAVVALLSGYESGPGGWQMLSLGSYLSRGAVAAILLGPITLLMGGTLTVLVRGVIGGDLRSAGWRVALLYGANTLGAATGAFLTDFALVPRTGVFVTQLVAVALNLGAAGGAFWLARVAETPGPKIRTRPSLHTRPTPRLGTTAAGQDEPANASGVVSWTAIALALSGFAALGIEIVWLRHLGVLLGGFRAVFSLLMTVMLVALGVGALLGGWLDRRFRQPLRTLMIVEALFVVTTLFGLTSVNAESLAVLGSAIAATMGGLTPLSRTLTETWFNLLPIIAEVALPSLVIGLTFPLANAVVQNVEASVGRRAGVLYAANTFGAVSGSIVAGYLLLPRIGMQASAAALTAVAALAIVPLYLAQDRSRRQRHMVFAGAAIASTGALAIWFALPADYLIRRAIGPRDASERLLTLSEGAAEILAVVERPGRGRGLLTNGHAMSSTAFLDQRYMRALAHIPLLSIEQPERVLVIGFGVGNTAHAATLHTSVKRVDIADLSTNILEHAGYFRDANRDVLSSPKSAVFVNDGRQHLQMMAPESYDLITLEPPPIAHAGVSALYSREFYQLARSRLTPGGYVSQWLPAYQVPEESSLAMVRAFLDVFPQSVLLSGAQAELLLVGTRAPRVELDPVRVETRLEQEPMVRDDLARVDLDSVQEIVGTFVGAAATLARATSNSPAVTDDWPLQEYGVLSGLSAGLTGVPSSLFGVADVAVWCPRCVDEAGRQTAPNLDLYLAFLQQAYAAPVASATALTSASKGERRLLGSRYLGAVVPDSAEVHNLVGIALMRDGRVDDAVREFRDALGRDSRSTNARANLGQIRYDQAAALLEGRRFSDAATILREVVALTPDSSEAHNDLGVALASMGQVEEAAAHFQRAVDLDPDFAEARQNLEAARRRPNPERSES